MMRPMPDTVSPDSDPFLAADEPPPHTVLNSDGAAPLLLICDHASHRVPRSLAGLGLPPQELTRHIGWDIGAAEVTRRLSRALDCTAVLCNWSRLVIDCNRDPADPEAVPEESDGTVIPGNRGLTEADLARRTDELFWPYHRAVGDSIAHLWRRGDRVPPAVFAVHSFTPHLRARHEERPWHVGFLWNRDPRLAVPLMRTCRDDGLVVGDNEPYDGREMAWTTEHHAAVSGLPHAGVEIRQDLVSDEAGCAVWAERLARALRPVLGDPHLHRVIHR